MTNLRKTISKKTRFEVFKRDSFACQYCGATAPQSVLRVDHIHPVSAGGEDDLMNLITACFDCNAGKGARQLDDDAAIQKQRVQLEELNERREQLEMLLEWRDGLRDLDDQQIDAMRKAWTDLTAGYYLNEIGLNSARRYLRKHGLQQCLDAIETARQYIRLEHNKDGKVEATHESVELAWHKIGGILAMQSKPEAERKMYYIKGILRNRVYVNHRTAMEVMRRIASLGGDMDFVERFAKECRSWTEWRDEMYSYIADLEKGEA